MTYHFPKIELHCHLDGAVRPETAMRLAKERGVSLPGQTLEDFRRFIQVTADCRDVNEYLKRFELPLQLMQDREGLYTVAYELVEMLAGQGLRWAELRFAPQLHCRQGLTQQNAIDAVCDGVRDAMDRYPDIKAGVLLCMMVFGDPSLNDAANRETVELARKNLGSLVRGVDLAGAEGLVPLSRFGYLFERVRAYGIPFTCHAGDSQGPDTVRDAMDFGAVRIGHGHHIWNDPELVQRAVREGTTLELCLTSNIQCSTQPSYEEHPVKKLYEAGVKTTLNTDNMVLSSVTLDSEYDLAIARCGLTEADIIRMNINSAKAAFMPECYREQLIAELEKAPAACPAK